MLEVSADDFELLVETALGTIPADLSRAIKHLAVFVDRTRPDNRVATRPSAA